MQKPKVIHEVLKLIAAAAMVVALGYYVQNLEVRPSGYLAGEQNVVDQYRR